MTDAFRDYGGESAVVRWSKTRCIHMAECVGGLPTVFDPEQRPWIQPDQASVDELATVVAGCPTGALQLVRKDGGAPEAPPARNVIRLATDGPLLAHADLVVDDTPHTRAALCRCGQSNAKP